MIYKLFIMIGNKIFKVSNFCFENESKANTIADAIMNRIVFDSYKINLEPKDQNQDFSIRETYELKSEYAE